MGPNQLVLKGDVLSARLYIFNLNASCRHGQGGQDNSLASSLRGKTLGELEKASQVVADQPPEALHGM